MVVYSNNDTLVQQIVALFLLFWYRSFYIVPNLLLLLKVA